MQIKSNTIHIKKLNKNKVYRYILKNREACNTELTAKLGISLPTVLQNTKELIDEGLIKEGGFFESTGGRKARVLYPFLKYRFSIGVDITKNHIGIAIVNLGGEILKHKRIHKKFVLQDEYYEYLGNLLDDFVKSQKIPKDKILGVGISLSGIIDPDARIIRYAHAIGKIENQPFEDIAKYIDYPKYYINDANAAATAELWARESLDTFVFLFLGNSVGGAIFSGGKMLTGKSHSAGELGHICIVPDGMICSCGKRGCVDPYCSALCLETQSGMKLADFFSSLNDDNPASVQIWDEYTGFLLRTIDILYMLFNCDIVIGGYVGRHLDNHHIKKLALKAAKYNIFGDDKDKFLRVCKRNEEASALGAALRFVEKFIASV